MQWLRRMANRDKYEIDGKKGKYIPLEKMFINLAFNQLSKGQLRYWLKNLFEQWNWNGVPISEEPEAPREKCTESFVNHTGNLIMLRSYDVALVEDITKA